MCSDMQTKEGQRTGGRTEDRERVEDKRKDRGRIEDRRMDGEQRTDDGVTIEDRKEVVEDRGGLWGVTCQLCVHDCGEDKTMVWF